MRELLTRFALASSAPLPGLVGQSTRVPRRHSYSTNDTGWYFCAPTDIDPATALILKEISCIAGQVVEGSIDLDITPDDFKYYWKAISEHTASSYSGLHMGHYKAATSSGFLSWMHATHLTIISRNGLPPDRWKSGLTFMLEKIAGVALVNKLRAILLMEADFNFHNKLIFGRKMLAQARLLHLIPAEKFSKKENTAEDGGLQKVLGYDISRQTCHP